MKLDIYKIRQDFPILHQSINGYPLIYFDNAATTQKPLKVIKAISEFYLKYNANIHRGVHYLSNIATNFYEQARKTVQHFINAKYEYEIIFTRGTTESINLIAHSFAQKFISKGDEIIITEMDHHANIVPWQQIANIYQAKIKIVPITEDFQLDFEKYKKLFSDKTKIVALPHLSNSLGTINPIKKFIDFAHKHNVAVLIDAAQSIQHHNIDVQKLDCDFLVFSGHKIYAETGIGVLYGKEKWLEQLPPYQFGGDMIKEVSFEKTIFEDLPLKFEAGTTNFVGAFSLKNAIDYILDIGLDNIFNYETQLINYAIDKISDIDGIQIYATKQTNKTSVLSFNIQGIHNYDLGMILNQMGIAVRTGKHCTHPLMNRLNIPGTVRASFAFYNTFEEIDKLVDGITKAKRMLV